MPKIKSLQHLYCLRIRSGTAETVDVLKNDNAAKAGDILLNFQKSRTTTKFLQ